MTICRNCGKECPDQKFCIFCGTILDNPDQFFMGHKFSSVEECNIVKRDYELLISKFKLMDARYTRQDIEKAIAECKKEKYHPIASQLSFDYLILLLKKFDFLEKRNKQLKKIRVISYAYAIVVAIFLVTLPITCIDGTNQTLLGMIQMMISGTMGFLLRVWNLCTIVGIVFVEIALFRLSRNNNAVYVPFVAPFFYICIWVVGLVPRLFGIDYEYPWGYWCIVITGLALLVIYEIILPKVPKGVQLEKSELI